MQKIKDMINYYTNLNMKDSDGDKFSKSKNKVFIKLARDMHDLFPHIALIECLKIIIARHQQNLITKKQIIRDSYYSDIDIK